MAPYHHHHHHHHVINGLSDVIRLQSPCSVCSLQRFIHSFIHSSPTLYTVTLYARLITLYSVYTLDLSVLSVTRRLSYTDAASYNSHVVWLSQRASDINYMHVV